MTLAETLDALTRAGGRLIFDDGELVADFPGDRDPEPELVKALKLHKPTLAAALAPPDPEREAIQWADTPDADAALQAALMDWGALEAATLEHCDALFMKADAWLWRLTAEGVGGPCGTRTAVCCTFGLRLDVCSSRTGTSDG